MSQRHQAPVSLSKISNMQRKISKKEADEIQWCVAIGTVTAAKPCDEIKLVKGIRVVALRVTEHAREQINSHSGEIMTIDEYLQMNPQGQNSTLVRPRTLRREADKYFGKPAGCKKSKTKARVLNKKRERANNKMFRRK